MNLSTTSYDAGAVWLSIYAAGKAAKTMNVFRNKVSKQVKPNLDQRFLDAVSNPDWQLLKRDRFDPTTTKEAIMIDVAVWSHPDVT